MKRKSIAFLVLAAVIGLMSSTSFAQVDYALGKSYTSNPPITPTSSWWLGEDPPWVKFTDGISAWAWGAVTGWQGSDAVGMTTITIDLGSVKTDIAKVQVDQFVSTSSAVYASDSARCLGSTDGTNFTVWGDMTTTGTSSDTETMWYWVYETASYKTAQYMMVEMDYASSVGGHKLLSEIWVFSPGATSVKDWSLYR
ncbi:MAG: hypothetical protein WCK47_10225 [bacterium]|nr:hypothetical protein [Candidatus Sumerlaeota bacterium]